MRADLFRPVVPLGLLLASMVAASTAPAADWTPFHNDRFGFSVDVPAGFTSAPPPENGDGGTFTSPDGRATILAYGHLFVDVEGLAQDEHDQERMSAHDGLDVTYRQVSSRATTFSGLRGDIVIYQHAIATCKGTASAIIHAEYPMSDKARLDLIVAHMVRTLRGSNACWSPG